jgi:hypothetical protein
MRAAVIIPAYNEEKAITKVIKDIPSPRFFSALKKIL